MQRTQSKKRNRSAKTGLYVSPKFAKNFPDTTVAETVHKDTLRLNWVCKNYKLFTRREIDSLMRAEKNVSKLDPIGML